MNPEHCTLLGIVGWPVHHSRSPAMHHAAIRHLNLNALYVPFAVRPEALHDAIAGLRALGVRGVNVTLPHKQVVISLLDEVEPAATAIGAVNTITNEGGRLVGTNTDAPGLIRSLEEAAVPLNGASAVVLGAGGAARAAVVGLAEAGVRRIVVSARREEQAEELLTELRGHVSAASLEKTAWSSLGDALPDADVLVQATSATLGGGPAAEAFANQVPVDTLPASATVVDMVYAPRTTTLLRAARDRSLKTVDGLGMLLHQGALSFTRWTGLVAPLEPMRAALEEV